MYFDLRNAAQTFQRFMDEVLRGLDFCFAYLDDIFVFSRTSEEHEQHLRTLFDRHQRHGILVNPAKFVFSAPEVTFLGHKVSAEGSRLLEERMTHLLDCPPPKTASQLRRFLGMLNFYWRLLPHAAATQAPLHAALSGPRVKGSHPIAWTSDLHRAFEKCKAKLSRAPLLAHPDPSAPLALVKDAFTTVMGAVLQQLVDNAWQPLAFFSRKLNPAQQKYSANDRELLAVYVAVKQFRHMLEARHFVIFTDHKPITYAFQQKRDKCSPGQFNHLEFVAQFTTDVRHISGQDNEVADAPSRVESITAAPSPDALAASQEGDGELRALLASDTALRLEKQQISGAAVFIYYDTSAGEPRPYVPGPLRLQVFQSVHDLSHPCTKATARLVAQRFVWPGIQRDCRTWSRVCQAYQRSKVSRHTVTPVGDFTLLAARFLHVHVKLVGPLPTSEGDRYCLTTVDRFTHRPEPIPIPDITAETVACTYVAGWISPFVYPQTITTDQGRQFESQLFRSLARMCGTQLSRTIRPPPSSQRSGGTLPPEIEGSHHVP
jgi:cleavage and polyadenylation specificity factor subunit 1